MVPFVFGVTAIGFGVASLVNSKAVVRFGANCAQPDADGAQPMSPHFVIIAISGSGQPSFWVFMPA